MILITAFTVSQCIVTDMAQPSTPKSTNVALDSTNVAGQDEFVDAMAVRVRRLAERHRVGSAELATYVKLKRSAMSNYWRGLRPYPVEVLPLLAKVLSTSVDYLVTGKASTAAEAAEDMDLVSVNEIDLAYGLGGTFSDGPVEVQTLHFPRGWIETITSTSPSMLTIARGRGDSMQPTIQDGDMVMIDRSQRIIREQDAIWALTIGDFAMIKRIRAGGERIRILSDNDRVPVDEVFHEEINIVGRVIFIGRRI